ncbi:hypothetical protein Tco_0867066, partial [Tanacetum coccineum]
VIDNVEESGPSISDKLHQHTEVSHRSLQSRTKYSDT